MDTISAKNRNSISFYSLLILLCLAMVSGNVFADQISWDGGGGDSLWTNPTNWSADAIPTLNDTVTINSNTYVLLDSTGECAALTLGADDGGTDTLEVLTGNQLSIDAGGAGTSGDLIINPDAEFALDGTATLYITGFWTNNGEFIENTSTVIFQGSTDIDIDNDATNLETFYNFIVLKTSGGNAVETTADTRLVIDGDLTISDGELRPRNVTIGSGSDLTVNGDVNLAQAGEGLDLSLANVTAEFTGDMNINDTNGHAIAVGATTTMIFSGTNDQIYGGTRAGAETLNRVEVNKSAGTLTVERPINFNSDLIIQNGTTDITNNSTLNLGNASDDSLVVQSGATFTLNGGTTLNVFDGSPGGAVSVETGGTFESLGTSDVSRTTISRRGTAGSFAFTVAGTIRAKYTDFSYTNNAGINLQDGSTLDATDNFDFSSFDQGTASPIPGRYLTVGNVTGGPQAFDIDSVEFTGVIPGGFNVLKVGGEDTLKFYGASGAFAGDAFDGGSGETSVLWFGTLSSITWTGTISNDWELSDNWNPARSPDATVEAIIPTGLTTYPVVDGDNLHAIRTVTVETGATLTVSDGDTLDVQEDFEIDGTTTLSGSSVLEVGGLFDNSAGTLTANTSTVILDGSSSQSFITGGTAAGKQFYNLSINKSGGSAILSGNLDVNNDIDIITGTFDAGSAANAITIANDWSNAGSFVNQGGTITFDGTGILTSGGSGAGKELYDVIFTGTTHSMAGDLQVENDLEIQTGAIIDVTAGNYNLLVGGDWTNDGTFTPQQGTVTLNGTANQNLDLVPHNFYNFTVDKASGSVLNSISGQIIITNDFTVNAGTFALTTDTLVVGGDLAIGSSGTLNIADDVVNVAGGWQNSGSLLAAPNSLIRFNATSGSHNVAEPTVDEIDFIEFGGAGTYTLVTSLDVDEDISITGTATLVLNEQQINVGRSWRNSANFNAGTAGTVVFDDASIDTIFSNGDAFYNLTINQATAGNDVYPFDDLDVNGDFTITQGEFRPNVYNPDINVGGSFVIEINGRMYPSSGMFTFDAGTGGPYTIDDGNNTDQFIDLTFNAGTNVTYEFENATDSETFITGDLWLLSGVVDMNGQTFNFGSPDGLDSIVVDGTYIVGPGAVLKMDGPQALNTGCDIIVRNGGTFRAVGTSGNKATISRIGEGASAVRKWRMFVKSGGTLEASYADFLHVDGTNGIYLETGSNLDPVNNFSNSSFDATSANGRYIKVDSLNGARTYDIVNVGFLNIPIGTSYNVEKLDDSDNILAFDGAYGPFAGPAFENDPGGDPGGQITWTNTLSSRTWDGSTSTAWSEPTNWVGDQVPTPDEDVLIPNVANDPVVSGNDSCRNVSFTAGGNITIQNGGELHVTGDLNFGASTNNGDITIQAGGELYVAGTFYKQYGDLFADVSSTVIFNGSGDQTFHTGGTGDNDDFGNLTINKSGGTVLLEQSVEVNGDFTLQSGSFDLSNGLGWNLEVEGDYVNSGGTLVPGVQTVFFNGTSGNINGGTGPGKEFYRVDFVSGTYTLTGDLDVNWELEISAGSTLDAGADYTIYLNRLADNDGTFLARNGTIVFDGTSSINLDLSGPTADPLYNLTINKLNDALVNVIGYVDVNGSFTLTKGIFDVDGTDTLDVEGDVTISVDGSLTRGGGNTGILVAGDWLNTGTFDDVSGGTVIFDGTNQSISGGFHDITLSGSGTKTAGETLDINRDILIESGVTFNGAGYNHTVARNWTNNGSYSPGGTDGTITFDQVGDKNITTGGTGAGKAFGNLVVNNTAGDATDDIIIIGDIKITGDFDLTDGDFHTETNNIDMEVGGNWSVGSGASFYPGTGSVTFNGTSGGPYDIDNGTPTATTNIFNTTSINATGVTYQLAADAEINDNLTISAGNFKLNGQTLQFGDGTTDSIKVQGGTLEVDAGASLAMYTAGGAGSDLVVQSGGIIEMVGASGNDATVTRFNGTGASDRYSFLVDNGATIQARYALFEYMDINGIQLETGSTIHAINNFSDVKFNNGPSGGRYLSVDDISGANQNITIASASFLTDPGGGAFNVDKSASTDSLIFDQATGTFAGESFENDPGNVVSWANPVTTRNWTGTLSNDWNTAGNWEGNQVPTADVDVNIPNVANDPVVSGDGSVAQSATLEAGATLTVSSGDTLNLDGSLLIAATSTVTLQGTSVLTIAGDYDNQGTIVENTSTLIFDGTGDQSVNARGTAGAKEFYNLTIDKSSGIATLASAIEVNGSLNIIGGTLDASASNYNIQVEGDWTNSGLFEPRLGTVTFATSGGTITTGGTASGKRFYNLTVAGSGVISLGGDLKILNFLNLDGSLDASTSNYDLYLGGNWDNDGTFLARNGSVIIDGSADQTLEVVATVGSFYNFEVNKSSGTATLTNSPLDINGTFDLTAGTLSFGANSIDIEGNSSISGTLTGTGTINAAGNWINTDGDLAGDNTTILDGAAQTFSGDFSSLTLAGTGTKTAGGVVDLAGNLTINSGVTFDAASYTHSIEGNWNNTNGNFTANTSTIVFSGSAASQNINAGGTGATKAFNNLQINKSAGSVSLPVSVDMEINGDFSITSGTMNFDGNTVNVAGSWDNSGTVTWTAGTGTVIFDGTGGTPTINDGSSNFANLVINATGLTYSLSSQSSINGDLSVTAGTLDLNGNDMQFGDSADDSIKVSGTFEVDAPATLYMYTAADTGAAIAVQNGGTIKILGDVGTTATLDRYNGTENTDKYTLTVLSGGKIETSQAVFRHINSNGVELQDGAILDQVNNFSDSEFRNFETGGTYLNVGDISGTNQSFNIANVAFLTDLDTLSGGSNVSKSNSTDTLKFSNSSGVFAGPLFENDPAGEPGGLIQWTGTQSAIAWTGAVNTAWDNTGNWQGGLLPTANDDAIIPATSNDPVVSGTQVARSVDVESGAVLTISSGDTLDLSGGLQFAGSVLMQSSSIVSVEGNFTNDGGSLTMNTGSRFVFDGSVEQTLSSGGTGPGKNLKNVDINKSSGNVNLGAATLIENNLNIVQGGLDVSASNHQLNVGGNWDNTGTFNARLGTVVFQGASTVTTGGTGDNKDFYNVILLGSATANVTLAGNMEIDNDLTIQTGSSFDVSTNNYGLNVGGDYNNDGTFTARNGTVTLDGATDQDLDAASTVGTFYNLTVNNTGGTVTLTEGPLDVNGGLTITAGTLNIQNINADIEGNVSINGTLTAGANSITAAGNWSVTGTFNSVGTVTLDGAAQAFAGNFNNITLSGTGTKTVGAALDVAGNITIASGVTFSAQSFTHNLAGNFSNSGSMIASSSTFNMDGAGNTQSITTGGIGGSNAFNNITVNKASGTVRLAAANDIDINGSLTISGGSFDANNNDVYIAGNLQSATSYLAGSGVLTFDGTSGGPYAIDAGGSTLNLVTINAPGIIYQLSVDTDIDQDITITAGTFDLNGRILEFGDSGTDTIRIAGVFEVDAGATLRMFTASGNGSDLLVNSGGTVRITGDPGNVGSVTRFNGTGASDRYSFTVDAGATIESRNAKFEYMDTQGISLLTGAVLDSANNFSSTTFDNGAANGRYINMGDIAGSSTYEITNAGFLSNPGGTSYNVDKIASDDSLAFIGASGSFAGAAFENDPGNDISWTGTVSAISWLGGGTSDWGTGSNWQGGSIPAADEDAIIPNGATPYPIVTGTQTVRGVQVESGASLTITDTDTLDMAGDLQLSGTLTLNGTSVLTLGEDFFNTGLMSANSSTVIFDGTSDQTLSTGGITVDKRFYNVIINKSGGSAILSNNIQVNNNLDIQAGSFDVGASNYTVTVGGDLTNSGTLNSRSGAVVLAGTATLTTGGVGAGKAFYDLTLTNSASIELAGNLDVNNDLNVQNATTLDVTTSNYNVNVAGDYNNDGSFNARQGTLTIDGTGDQDIDNDAQLDALYNFVINKASGTATLSAGNMDIDGNLTLTAGTFSSGAFAFDVEGDVTVDGNWSTGVSNSITAAGNWTGSGSFSGSNTVTLDGSNQNIGGDFNNLVLSGSATKTAVISLDVAGNFTINSGITFVSGNLTHTIGGNWNNQGTYTSSTGTITFDGTGTQSLVSGGAGAGKLFNNLTVNKSAGTMQLATGNDLDVNGDLTITSGTVDANNNDLFIEESFENAGTYIAGSGTITFDGTGGTHNINSGGSGLNTVSVNANTTTYQLSGTTDINGNLTVTAGALDLNGQILTFGDNASDAISIADSLVIDDNAELRMFTGSGGTGLTVASGGRIIVIGSSGNRAILTRFNGTQDTDRYSFTVASGAFMEANYATFEYMNTSGINLQTGSALDVTNNFSNTNFQNGPSSGSFLQIGDLGTPDTLTITSTGFLSSEPTYNVDKAAAGDDSLTFDQSFGVLAGDANENDAGNHISWINVVSATQWTGASSNDWSVAGNWTSGVPTASDDAIIPNVSNDPVVSGTQVARNVTIQSGAVLTVSNTDTLDLSGSLTNSGIITMQGNAQLNIAADYLNSGTLTPNSSKVTFNGTTNQSINTGGTASGKRFFNVTIDKAGGSAILAGNIDINGDLTITNGSLDAGAGNYSMNVAGDWNNSGTLVPQNGMVTFDGSSAQSLDPGVSGSFYDLTIASSNTVSLSSNNLDVDNDFTVNTGATFNAAALNASIGGDFANSGTFTAGTGTVIFNGTASSNTITSGGSSFNDVQVSAGASSSYLLSSSMNINGDLNITSGKLDVGSSTLTLGAGSDDSFTIGGTLEVDANGTLEVDDSGDIVVSSGGNLSLVGTGASSLADITRQSTGNYQITVQSGGTINAAFARFNYTGGAGVPGINIEAGATINASNAFDNSIFQNGAGTTYLEVNNGQNLTIDQIEFYTGPTYNIDYQGSGTLNVNDYLGSLAGARFENDAGGDVFWQFVQSEDLSAGSAVTFGNDITIDPVSAGTFGQVTVELVDGIVPSAPRSVGRYYLVTPAGIGGATAAVTIAYADDELGAVIEANLNLWRRSGVNWDGPTDPDAHNTTTNAFTVNSTSWTLGLMDTLILSDAENDQSLPVELVAFNAESEKGTVTIKWQTASELNNAYFLLERSEKIDEGFEVIAQLEGQGNKATETEYKYIDEDVNVATTYYYRLTDVDYSGKRHSSETIDIKVAAPMEFRLSQNYPNPFNNATKMAFDLPEPSRIDIAIFNILGQQVFKVVDEDMDAGFYVRDWNGFNSSGASVASGIYIIRMNARSNVSDKQFSKVIKAVLLK